MAATMSILGLYNYDPNIFELLHLPDSVQRQTIIDLIISEAAELEILYPNPDILRVIIGAWSNGRQNAWARIAAALDADYNPIENTDSYEDHLEDYTRDLKESDNYTRDLKESDNYTRDLKENDNYTRNLTDSGNNNSSGNTQNSRTGYNSGDLQVTDSSSSEDHSDDTRSYTGGDDRNKGYTGGDERNKGYTGGDDRNKGFTGGDTRHTVIHTHGNIGVTTNQRMVQAELELRQTDIYSIIVNEFIDKFCIGVY